LYFRFPYSLRDIKALLRQAARGLAYRVKAARRKLRNTWHRDEMFVSLRAEPYLRWRADDAHGAEPDTVLQKRRDTAAARRFCRHVLRPTRYRIRS
jgi:putative transposase